MDDSVGFKKGFKYKKIVFLFLMIKDFKYLAAYSIPPVTVFSLSQDGWGMYSTTVYVFVIVPIADWMFGKGKRNLDAKEVQKKEPMRVFDYMLYLNVPVV